MASSRTDALRTEIANAVGRVEGVIAVYLFGSGVDKHKPNDVDLVVVYGPPLTALTAPGTRNLIENAVRKTFGLRAHLVFFTEREAEEHRSSDRVTSQRLYSPVADEAS